MAGKEQLAKNKDPDRKGDRNSIVPVAAAVGFLRVEKGEKVLAFCI